MTSKRGITLKNCLGEGVSVASRGKGFIQINGRGVLLPEDEAIRLRDWLNAKYPAPPAAAHGSSEEHRNQMADTIVSLRTEIAALRRNAAAHGDEAVRKDAEAAYVEMTCQPVLIDGATHYYLSSEKMQAFDRLFSVDVSAAAMRAQVDGEAKA